MKVKFGEIVLDTKAKVDRNDNPYDYYVAGDHMDSEDLEIHRRGCFATDDVGPAFIRLFHAGQVLYGSRRTYLKKIAVADFDGVTANTTFVFETKDPNVLAQELLPFIMLSNKFTEYSILKSKGSTNPYVLFSDLADYEFELPDIEKQRELADLLWSMEYSKRAYRKMIEATDELVKSQFIEMFGSEKNKALLRDLSDMVTVGIANAATHAYADNGVLMFRNQNIKANGLDDSDLVYIMPEFAKRYASKTLKANDILVARTGYPGTACIVPEKYAGAQTFTTLIVRIKQNPDLLPAFVCNYINSAPGQEYVKQNEGGSAQVNFGASALSRMPIILPPVELQKKYLAFAEQSDKSK